MRKDRPAATNRNLVRRKQDLSFDEVWDGLVNDPDTALDQELLGEAVEYVRQKYDETYWEAVRKEAEAFWDRRYDPDATEDW